MTPTSEQPPPAIDCLAQALWWISQGRETAVGAEAGWLDEVHEAIVRALDAVGASGGSCPLPRRDEITRAQQRLTVLAAQVAEIVGFLKDADADDRISQRRVQDALDGLRAARLSLSDAVRDRWAPPADGRKADAAPSC